MRTLLLQAVDVASENNWRWRLSDAETGILLADQFVALQPASSEYDGFADLPGYLQARAIPDRRPESEAALLARLGDWLGSQVLGTVGTAIAEAAPVNVRVTLPAELGSVLNRPLGLAQVNGAPVARQAGLAFGIPGAADLRQRPKQPVGDSLRMLAVFSMPTTVAAGSLRRERYALSRLIRDLGARLGTAVELRVLQYGVTRGRLEAVLEEGEGWDVVHLSGHGDPAGSGILLERADGSPDLLTTDDLTRMLRLGRSRLKLIVISNNQPPAIGVAERRRYLGLGETPDREPRPASGAPLPGLALRLAERLECTVLATRYPLAEETTVRLNDRFYSRLFGRGENVAAALAAALAAVGDADSSAALLTVASPVLIGSRAADLTLLPPRGTRPDLNPAVSPLAYFRAEPARFVGRESTMAQASAALAPESKYPGVLLHGLAGAGKTACALELAYRHADGFERAVWWHAPAEYGADAALASLATALEIQLDGFSFIPGLADTASYLRHLRGLTALMEARPVLMVLDGLDTLLTPAGVWRDPRWGELIRALASQRGESRVILTSRVPLPADDKILALPVTNLSLDETIQLAGELPNLRRLLHTDADPAGAASAAAGGRAAQAADRDRALRLLRVVQGHPKLVELADAAAADPARLDAQLAAAEDATGERLEAFFGEGTSALEPERVLDALTAWTTYTLRALSPEARLMAEFVACLEEDDRRSDVMGANWADLWRRLARPGDPPAPEPLLAALAAAALVDAIPVPAAAAPDAPALYQVHAGVAAAIASAADSAVHEAVDTELAAFWYTVFAWALEREGGEDSAVVVRASLAAAPYLLRRQDWRTAGGLLEQAALRDESPGVVQAVLPSLRRIAAATGAPTDAGRLGRVLMRVDPAEAERLLRGARDAAAAAGDYQAASAAAGDLFNLLLEAGRLAEALAVAGQKPELTRLAGLGPWTQLLDAARRLQVLGLMGEHAQVLAEVERLRASMADLPARGGPDETVNPWNVRETILGTGSASAQATGEWARCLELNAEVVASMRGRGAGVHEVTRFRFNDAGPLLELGRTAEAGRLLAECQRVFEDHADTTSLARALSVRAILEDRLGRAGAAADLGRAALRLSYARPEPRDIMIGHHNLASYLGRLGGERAGQRAHRLADALICHLAGMAHDLAQAVDALAEELRAPGGADPSLPSALAEVVAVAEQTEGVRLAALLAALEPDQKTVELALDEIRQAAAAQPSPASGPDDREASRPVSADEQRLPAIPAIVAAAGGDQDASAAVSDLLARLSGTPEWAALVTVLRRLLDGERDPGRLTAGIRAMDVIDVGFVERVLAGLHGPDSAQVRAWRASPVAERTRRPANEISSPD